MRVCDSCICDSARLRALASVSTRLAGHEARGQVDVRKSFVLLHDLRQQGTRQDAGEALSGADRPTPWCGGHGADLVRSVGVADGREVAAQGAFCSATREGHRASQVAAHVAPEVVVAEQHVLRGLYQMSPMSMLDR